MHGQLKYPPSTEARVLDSSGWYSQKALSSDLCCIPCPGSSWFFFVIIANRLSTTLTVHIKDSFFLFYPSWIIVFHIYRLVMKIKTTLHFTNILILPFISVILVLVYRHLLSGNVHPSTFLSPLLWLSSSLSYLSLLEWLFYFSFLHMSTVWSSFAVFTWLASDKQ